MIFFESDFPENIFELKPETLENVEKCGLETGLKKCKIDFSREELFKKIYRLRNSGWRFFNIEFDITTGKTTLLEEIKTAHINNLFFPVFNSAHDETGNGTFGFHVLVKKAEHAELIKCVWIDFLNKSARDETVETIALNFHKKFLSGGII